MKKEKRRVVYQAEPIRDFRELIDRTTQKYPDQIAYKYKVRKTKDVKALSTGLLEMGLENKRIAVIRK